VRVRPGPGKPLPLLDPAQVQAILDDCARFDPEQGRWIGSVRDRLLFATLAETGLRLGECLALRHRDVHTGRGDTPFVEVTGESGHPHHMRAKYGRFRRVYVSDDRERLYSEYLWQLVDAGAADVMENLEDHWVFVNLSRGERFGALRPESLYAKVRAIKAHLGAAVPIDWTPHWFRHSHVLCSWQVRRPMSLCADSGMRISRPRSAFTAGSPSLPRSPAGRRCAGQGASAVSRRKPLRTLRAAPTATPVNLGEAGSSTITVLRCRPPLAR